MKNFFILLFITLLFFNSGCLTRDIEDSPYYAPSVVNFVKTLDINRFIDIAGNDTLGNGTDEKSDYDLTFYSVGSDNLFGVKSGFFNDQYGNKTYLKFMDLGEIDFEFLQFVPENGTVKADYKFISDVFNPSDVEDNIHTLFKLNHVYSIYKWNNEGGNYLKLFVQRIDKNISRIQIRGTYQTRQGITETFPSNVPL
jgi:hypothetical protein